MAVKVIRQQRIRRRFHGRVARFTIVQACHQRDTPAVPGSSNTHTASSNTHTHTTYLSRTLEREFGRLVKDVGKINSSHDTTDTSVPPLNAMTCAELRVRGADHFIRDALAGCRDRFEALQSCKSVALLFNRERCAMPYQACNRKTHGGGRQGPAFKMMQEVLLIQELDSSFLHINAKYSAGEDSCHTIRSIILIAVCRGMARLMLHSRKQGRSRAGRCPLSCGDE
jgi:hypothetical protein